MYVINDFVKMQVGEPKGNDSASSKEKYKESSKNSSVKNIRFDDDVVDRNDDDNVIIDVMEVFLLVK